MRLSQHGGKDLVIMDGSGSTDPSFNCKEYYGNQTTANLDFARTEVVVVPRDVERRLILDDSMYLHHDSLVSRKYSSSKMFVHTGFFFPFCRTQKVAERPQLLEEQFPRTI